MSGVIDKHGQQWEHCSKCYGWVRIQQLYYPIGTQQQLCSACALVLLSRSIASQRASQKEER